MFNGTTAYKRIVELMDYNNKVKKVLLELLCIGDKIPLYIKCGFYTGDFMNGTITKIERKYIEVEVGYNSHYRVTKTKINCENGELFIRVDKMNPIYK